MHCSDGNKYPGKLKETRANCKHLPRIWKITPASVSLRVECPLAVSVGVVMELEYTTELGAKLSAWQNK